MFLVRNLAARLKAGVLSGGRLSGNQAGQSLIETALILPFLMVLAFNAINFGYFVFAAVNIAATPRTAAEYSILGPSTPGNFGTYPSAGSPGATCSGTPAPCLTVSSLAYEDLQKVLVNSGAYTGAGVQVCTQQNGLNNSGLVSETSVCTQYNTAGATWTPHSDPEAPTFVLNRVDIQYTVRLPIPLGRAGGFPLSFLPNPPVIHRYIEMRAM